MPKLYCDESLVRSTLHEWFKQFKEGREDLNDDEHTGRPRSAVNEGNVGIVNEFIREGPKSSLHYIEM